MLMFLCFMVFDYDFFIVGRICGENYEVIRGIENWCEFEEFGVIGDFLVFLDFLSKIFVLVV